MKKYTFYTVFVILFVFFTSDVKADMGPKPSASIHITQNGQPIHEQVNSSLEICSSKEQLESQYTKPDLSTNQYNADGDCYWNKGFLNYEAKCTNGICSYNYFAPNDFRITIFVPSENKYYVSNRINTNNFYADYSADLRKDETILIKETTPYWKIDPIFSISKMLTITLILEIGVALLFSQKKRFLASVILANIISVPIFYFVSKQTMFASLGILSYLISECIIILFEAYVIKIINRDFNLKRSLKVSIAMNLFSAILGGFIAFYFLP